jgi:hypothetical protein
MLKNPLLLLTAVSLMSAHAAKADPWTAWSTSDSDSAILYRTHDEKSGGTPDYWHEIQFRNLGPSDKTVELYRDGVLNNGHLHLLAHGLGGIQNVSLYIPQANVNWTWYIIDGWH